MGLPKNFQQTVNLNKRLKSLNDLTFYFYIYDVVLTSKTINEFYDNNKSFDDLEQHLGEITFLGNKLVTCKNRVSALNKEKADKKLNQWLGNAIEMGLIERYDIIKVKEKTFNEEITEKGLNNILDLKRG